MVFQKHHPLIPFHSIEILKTYCPILSQLVDFFFGFQTFRGSLTAVSTPIFASKASFFHVFRALHFFLCTVPEFCDFSISFAPFFAQNRKKSRPNYRGSESSWLCALWISPSRLRNCPGSFAESSRVSCGAASSAGSCAARCQRHPTFPQERAFFFSEEANVCSLRRRLNYSIG